MAQKYANILFDDAFKVVVCSPEHESLLIRIIELLVPGKSISRLKFRDKENHGYYGVRLAQAWDLNHLPSEKTFLTQLENLRPERKTGDTVRFITQRIKKKTERGESR